MGVGAVGIWDELFFICTVFVLLCRHFPVWQANLLQAVCSFHFSGSSATRHWGPLLTIPFALLQGFIFMKTRSLEYVVTVHLLFDAVVFLVLAHALQPGVVRLLPGVRWGEGAWRIASARAPRRHRPGTLRASSRTPAH